MPRAGNTPILLTNAILEQVFPVAAAMATRQRLLFDSGFVGSFSHCRKSSQRERERECRCGRMRWRGLVSERRNIDERGERRSQASSSTLLFHFGWVLVYCTAHSALAGRLPDSACRSTATNDLEGVPKVQIRKRKESK